MQGLKPILLYGMPIRDVLARGNLDEMLSFSKVSETLLANAVGHESEEVNDWKVAHQELLAAISEKSCLQLSTEDILTIKDSIIVIDNQKLARTLRPLTDPESKARIEVKFSVKE